ncbi:MAG: sigma-70 family RNA polymerase sigma factor [Akkermansiaceae bacterium]|nr:sigma-70 family RNA polymerase sigma factor [Armatimonadota bacterium]
MAQTNKTMTVATWVDNPLQMVFANATSTPAPADSSKPARRPFGFFGTKDDKPADVAPAGRPADPDFLLVRAHLAGDSKAFETLFKKYQTPIFSMVCRMVRGEDAYDITQDVFIKALRAIPSFRGDSKVSTWLYTIARHTCLNHIRHKNVIEEESWQESQEDNPNCEPIDYDMNVSKLAEVRELQRVVDEVLATLPTEARMLLILRDFEQLSYDEISQVTELSIVNVKSKIHRARLVFKKRFQPFLDLLEGGIGR